MINEADQLDREVNEHLSQIERNNDECQTLMAHVLENGCFRSDLMQCMAGFQTQLIDLRRQLQDKKRKSEEKRRRVSQIRDEEDSYAIAASYKEEEADKEEEQSEEVEREAQRIEQELEQLSENASDSGTDLGDGIGPREGETCRSQF